MTPDDAAEDRVEEEVEEEEAAVFLLEEVDGTRSATSDEADELSRVDLRDCAGMLPQVSMCGGNVIIQGYGVKRSICGSELGEA